MDTQWQKLSPAQKQEARFAEWMAPQGLPFASPEAERAYKERAQMFKDAVQLKKPQRVPIALLPGIVPFSYGGITVEEAMYDYDKLGHAMRKFNTDFETDIVITCLLTGAGKVFEILDYKLYRWPGHGVALDSQYQCVETEYMRADEYDLLINDPSGYWMRCYLPRVFGALGPWQMLSPLTDVIELPFTGGFMVPFGMPDVQQAFKKLLEAGQAALEWINAAVGIDVASMTTLGLPPLFSGYTKAPFDTLGDTLRGTRAIMLDKFRQPQKVLAAVERLAPLNVEAGVRIATANHGPFVFIPLHKGADGFMSNDDFKKFYWPSLKAVIVGLVREGLVPLLFVEGGYNERLSIVADPDIPACTTLWLFDRTDMKEVKKHFGGWAAFGGNLPVSLLQTGTPQDVRSNVKKLLDDVAGDGGFVLAPGAVVDHARPENLHAWIDAGREYGIYR